MNLKHLFTKLNPFKAKLEEKIEEIEEIESIEPEPNLDEPKVIGRLGKEKKLSGLGVHTWKLTEQQKQIIVSHWAAGNTATEVSEMMKIDHNIDVSPAQIHYYSRNDKWQPLIRKIRQEKFMDLSTVAGSHKKVRLERGEKIYEKSLNKGKLDTALKAVEHQRKEMEGDNSQVSLTLNQFNVLSDEELEFKRKQVMDRIQLMSKEKK